MTDSAINKKSKRSIWIPLLVLITLAACATAGYSYWRMQQQPTTNAKAEPAPPPAPVFFCAGYVYRQSGRCGSRVVYRRDPASERRSDARAIK
ncbi:flagellar basal body-associated protein FliL [Salmonella sp. NCTC 11881]|nr:flagellar basal body-associated protein FliL [Salmonella sp. NCTC 11881]